MDVNYFKNLNKHINCSQCNIVLTQDNYKKGRTVCRCCYNNNVLRYYKNKFSSNSVSKTNVSTQTDFIDELNSSNNQIKSKKQIKTTKRAISNNLNCTDKGDISCNFIKDLNPKLLSDRLEEILSKSDMLESDYIMSKMLLDELLRTKSILKKDYNAICKSLGLL